MRLEERFIPREDILNSVDTYEIIERYPTDKYLPSYLIYARCKDESIHIQVAVDAKNNNITIITAYKPALSKWEKDFKARRKS